MNSLEHPVEVDGLTILPGAAGRKVGGREETMETGFQAVRPRKRGWGGGTGEEWRVGEVWRLVGRGPGWWWAGGGQRGSQMEAVDQLRP